MIIAMAGGIIGSLAKTLFNSALDEIYHVSYDFECILEIRNIISFRVLI